MRRFEIPWAIYVSRDMDKQARALAEKLFEGRLQMLVRDAMKEYISSRLEKSIQR